MANINDVEEEQRLYLENNNLGRNEIRQKCLDNQNCSLCQKKYNHDTVVAYLTNCIHLYHFICYVNQRVTTAAGDVVKCSLDRTPLVVAGCFMYVCDENLMYDPYPYSEHELLTEEAQNEAEDDAAVARVTMCDVCHCSYGDRPIRFLPNCNYMYHIDCFNTEFRNVNRLRCVRCSQPFRLGNYKDHRVPPWLLNR